MEQAKKECILVEAARAFARWGFKKASIDEIAKAAGVAKGTVYLAADSKEDLYYQSLHRELRRWAAELSKLIDPRVPADEILVAMSSEGLRQLVESPLMRELLTGRSRELLPLWGDRLDELRRIGLGTVIEVLQLGTRQGVFRADMDLEMTASLLQDMQVATYIFHSARATPEEIVRRQVAAFAMILGGLRERADEAPRVPPPATHKKRRAAESPPRRS